MISYELAKELEKAGFPQPDEPKAGARYIGVEGKGVHYSPTLSELIDACGGSFKRLWRHSNGKWTAHAGTKSGKDSVQVDGKIPKEAVAKLWLSLNKK